MVVAKDDSEKDQNYPITCSIVHIISTNSRGLLSDDKHLFCAALFRFFAGLKSC